MSCQGCTQAAIQNEAEFQSTLKLAIAHVTETRKAVKVFKEMQEWHFIDASSPAGISTPSRTMVYWDARTATAKVN